LHLVKIPNPIPKLIIYHQQLTSKTFLSLRGDLDIKLGLRIELAMYQVPCSPRADASKKVQSDGKKSVKKDFLSVRLKIA
jgi:hypothetical protein